MQKHQVVPPPYNAEVLRRLDTLEHTLLSIASVVEKQAENTRALIQSTQTLVEFEADRTRNAAEDFFRLQKTKLDQLQVSANKRFNGLEEHIDFIHKTITNWDMNIVNPDVVPAVDQPVPNPPFNTPDPLEVSSHHDKQRFGTVPSSHTSSSGADGEPAGNQPAPNSPADTPDPLEIHYDGRRFATVTGHISSSGAYGEPEGDQSAPNSPFNALEPLEVPESHNQQSGGGANTLIEGMVSIPGMARLHDSINWDEVTFLRHRESASMSWDITSSGDSGSSPSMSPPPAAHSGTPGDSSGDSFSIDFQALRPKRKLDQMDEIPNQTGDSGDPPNTVGLPPTAFHPPAWFARDLSPLSSQSSDFEMEGEALSPTEPKQAQSTKRVKTRPLSAKPRRKPNRTEKQPAKTVAPAGNRGRHISASEVEWTKPFPDFKDWPQKCRLPKDQYSWACCDNCQYWYHSVCVGIPNGQDAKEIKGYWLCPPCSRSDPDEDLQNGIKNPHSELTLCARTDCRAGMVGTQGEELYEVECLLGRRKIPGSRYYKYLVKWCGYRLDECTWETHSRVTESLITEFDQRAAVEGLEKRPNGDHIFELLPEASILVWPEGA